VHSRLAHEDFRMVESAPGQRGDVPILVHLEVQSTGHAGPVGSAARALQPLHFPTAFVKLDRA
jgi:hypothetical protein